MILAIVGYGEAKRMIGQSAHPIVFTADPQMLRVQNPLETPPDRTLGVFELSGLTLRPHPLLPNAFQLEVATKGFPDRPAIQVSLLVSPSFETLDKIGRTLAETMQLPTPVAGPQGWRTDDGLIATAPIAPPVQATGLRVE